MTIRVLIFDDEDMIRQLFKNALSSRDYEILDFQNPSECPIYKKCKCDCKPNEMCADIIITDIRMPVVDGLTFIKKQRNKKCKVKNILMVSGYMSDKMKRMAAELGCICLRKPFDLDELMDVMDEFEKNIDPDRILIDWDSLK